MCFLNSEIVVTTTRKNKAMEVKSIPSIMQMKLFTFHWAFSVDKIQLTLCVHVCEGMAFSRQFLRFLNRYSAVVYKKHHSIAALSFSEILSLLSQLFPLGCRVSTFNLIPWFWSSSHPGQRCLKRTSACSSACTSGCPSNGNWAWRNKMRLTNVSYRCYVMILCPICFQSREAAELFRQRQTDLSFSIAVAHMHVLMPSHSVVNLRHFSYFCCFD